MKKVLKILFICVFAILVVFFFRKNNIKIENLTTSFDSLINKSDFTYTKDFKVNKLQIANSDYYYNKLTDSQKIIYSSIAKGVNKYEKNISVKNYIVKDNDTSYNDVSAAMEAFFTDHPEVFYLNYNYQLNNVQSAISSKLEIQVTYTDVAYKINEQINELDDKIKEMTSDISSLNDFEKELAVHDKLGKLSSYYTTSSDDIPQICHTSYGAIISKSAVCDGFTKAMQLLLDRVKIESIFVSGVTDNKAHAWNLVKINNNWYHMDLTSDKLVKQTDGTTPNLIHSYFNITDDQIQQTHKINNKERIPEATATQYNYYIYTNNYIYGSNDFETKLKEIVNFQNNNSILEFATDNITDVPTKMTKIFYNINFNNLAQKTGSISVNYYNVLNSYIVIK